MHKKSRDYRHAKIMLPGTTSGKDVAPQMLADGLMALASGQIFGYVETRSDPPTFCHPNGKFLSLGFDLSRLAQYRGSDVLPEVLKRLESALLVNTELGGGQWPGVVGANMAYVIHTGKWAEYIRLLSSLCNLDPPLQANWRITATPCWLWIFGLAGSTGGTVTLHHLREEGRRGEKEQHTVLALGPDAFTSFTQGQAEEANTFAYLTQFQGIANEDPDRVKFLLWNGPFNDRTALIEDMGHYARINLQGNALSQLLGHQKNVDSVMSNRCRTTKGKPRPQKFLRVMQVTCLTVPVEAYRGQLQQSLVADVLEASLKPTNPPPQVFRLTGEALLDKPLFNNRYGQTDLDAQVAQRYLEAASDPDAMKEVWWDDLDTYFNVARAGKGWAVTMVADASKRAMAVSVADRPKVLEDVITHVEQMRHEIEEYGKTLIEKIKNLNADLRDLTLRNRINTAEWHRYTREKAFYETQQVAVDPVLAILKEAIQQLERLQSQASEDLTKLKSIALEERAQADMARYTYNKTVGLDDQNESTATAHKPSLRHDIAIPEDRFGVLADLATVVRDGVAYINSLPIGTLETVRDPNTLAPLSLHHARIEATLERFLPDFRGMNFLTVVGPDATAMLQIAAASQLKKIPDLIAPALYIADPPLAVERYVEADASLHSILDKIVPEFLTLDSEDPFTVRFRTIHAGISLTSLKAFWDWAKNYEILTQRAGCPVHCPFPWEEEAQQSTFAALKEDFERLKNGTA